MRRRFRYEVYPNEKENGPWRVTSKGERKEARHSLHLHLRVLNAARRRPLDDVAEFNPRLLYRIRCTTTCSLPLPH